VAGNQRHRDRSLIGLAFFTFCRLQRNEQLWRGAGVADCRLKRRQAEELIISPALHVLLWTSTVLRGRRAVLVHAGWYPAVTPGGHFRDDFTAGLVQVWVAATESPLHRRLPFHSLPALTASPMAPFSSSFANHTQPRTFLPPGQRHPLRAVTMYSKSDLKP